MRRTRKRMYGATIHGKAVLVLAGSVSVLRVVRISTLGAETYGSIGVARKQHDERLVPLSELRRMRADVVDKTTANWTLAPERLPKVLLKTKRCFHPGDALFDSTSSERTRRFLLQSRPPRLLLLCWRLPFRTLPAIVVLFGQTW